MNYLIFFFLNFLSYFIMYKFSFLITKNKYIYPFRLADIVNFFFNLIIFIFLSNYYFGYQFFFETIIINLNFFYIFYHIINLINTSPRMRILIFIFENKIINRKMLYKNYNETIIFNNRVKRFLSNKEISVKNDFIKLNNKTISFFKIAVFIMNFVKKI
jgi:hypothetical protein